MASAATTLNCNYRFNAAFTLIELLMTVAIAAILVTVAVPSFNTLILNARLSAKKNEFINALNLARTTALALNSNIEVCPFSVAGSTTCGAKWKDGWIIKTTPSNTSPAPALIKEYQSSPKDAVLSAVAFNGGAATLVSFDPRGLSTTVSYFTLCDSRGSASATSMQVLITGYIQAGLGPTPGLAIWGAQLSCP